MYAIAIDLNVAEANKHHPKGQRRAYTEIATTLRRFGFERVQWSVFAAQEEDLSRLFGAMSALMAFDWFAPSVTSVRAFRMEQGSDFTALVKGGSRD